ncbi:MAG TPA: hypothetical protein VJQ46_09435 [Gemmatimonadales bacterium]|nr:hypothetical protein [Gemmatimonadales bacterium]
MIAIEPAADTAARPAKAIVRAPDEIVTGVAAIIRAAGPILSCASVAMRRAIVLFDAADVRAASSIEDSWLARHPERSEGGMRSGMPPSLRSG